VNSTIVILAIATAASTFIGGVIAIKLRRVLHYFFAFSAGALIAVAFLDILPESVTTALQFGLPLHYLFLTVVLSFLFYNTIDRIFATQHMEGKEETHQHIMGPIGATGLVIHSFIDGVAIGSSFQLSPVVGFAVAIAVISHDFTDGINTVTIMFKNWHSSRNALFFLVLDALAPVVGILLISLFSVSPIILSIILAIFVGEFIYLGASNILPETRRHTPWKMVSLICVGIAVITLLTTFA
jgi:ZIP family zinc transporter